jgi:hypothetical protein
MPENTVFNKNNPNIFDKYHKVLKTKYFYAMGINYFCGHFEGGIRGVLCHGIKIEESVINLFYGIRIK